MVVEPIAELDDGRRVVVRVPVDDAADADLGAEARALRAGIQRTRAAMDALEESTRLNPRARAMAERIEQARLLLGANAAEARRAATRRERPAYRPRAGIDPRG